MQQLVVSADSHVVEPADLWTDRLDRRFEDRAPRVIKDEAKGYLFLAEGVRSMAVSLVFSTGKSGTDLHKEIGKGYQAARSSGWDPAARIKDQDVDGVAAEVIYTSLGMQLFGLNDIELLYACFRVYNDFVAEFGSYNPKRLYPIGLVALDDISEAVKELQRSAKIGLRGAQIWGVPPADKPYSSRIYDPVWAAAQDLQMPLSLHVATSKNQAPTKQEFAVEMGSAEMLATRMNPIHDIQRTLLSIILSGVLDRFPGLKLISAENDSGWVGHFCYRMDRQCEKWTPSERRFMAMRPTEYMRRNVWVTFQDDPLGPIGYKYYGEDNLMWASDFPHTDSTWPNSQKVIDQDFADVPASVTQKIVAGNAVKLYRMDFPAV